MGTIISYSSPVLPELESSGEVELSESQKSLFGSLVPLGCLFGALSGGTQNRFFGKKKTLLICALPFLVGWILVIMSGIRIPCIANLGKIFLQFFGDDVLVMHLLEVSMWRSCLWVGSWEVSQEGQ